MTAIARLEPSASDRGEIQPAEPIRIGKRVDHDDPPVLDRHSHNRKWTPVGRPRDGAGYPVHEDPGRRFAEVTEGRHSFGNGPRAANQRDQTRTRLPAVGAQHDLGVEDGDEAFEVTIPRRRTEGADDGLLAINIDVRNGGTLDAATGTARLLPHRRRRSADDRCELVERHGEDVMQHEGDPFGGRQGVEDNQQREPY